MKTNNLNVFWLLVTGYLLLVTTSPLAHAADVSAFDTLAKIPVQHSGRVKPFQSFAQETVLYITGKNHFQKLSPTEAVFSWMAEPEKWIKTPLIPVSYQPLQQEFSLAVIGGRISPEMVLGHQAFLKQVEDALARRRQKERLSRLEEKRIEVYERAAFFKIVGQGKLPGWIAHPEDSRKSWLPLEALVSPEGETLLIQFFPEENVQKSKAALQVLFKDLREKRSAEITLESAAEFSQSLKQLFESRGIVLDQNLLQTEVTYNQVKPFSWAWKFYFGSVLVSLILMSGGFRLIGKLGEGIGRTGGFFLFLTGFVLHSYGFYLRCVIAGRPPVTNMYESIIWVSWAVVFFSLILSLVYRSVFIRVAAAVVSTLALIIAQGFPTLLDPSVSPLVPVLRSNLWLTVHVLTITLSYGAFALGWGIGHAAIFNFAFARDKNETQQTLTLYLYRTLQIGVVLLASGTVLGGVWANYSWGRFWGWDPKETWALIALLGYLAVLHGRFAGRLDSFGFAVWSTVAFLGILMAWYGVNFVLAAGLHSYGFGGGGLPYVLAVVLLDLALISGAAFAYKKRNRQPVVSK